MNLYRALEETEAPPGLNAFTWGRAAANCVEEEMRFDGAHDRGHLVRVFQNARRITSGEREAGREVDWEVVAASAVFHDAVNPPKDSERRERAALDSARLADEFFEERDALDEERRRRVFEAIEQHSYSRGLEAESIEAAILQDADRLEAIGAVGVARCFWVSGAMAGSVAHYGDPFGEGREFDDESFAVDHFFEKLLDLEESLETETGRELATDRAAFLETFLRQYARETGHALPASMRSS